MLAALSAALVALAVALALPGVAQALRSWAQRLHRSRRTTVERQLPESFLFVDSRWYAVALVTTVLSMTILVAFVSRSGVLGSAAGAATLLLPSIAARQLRKRRQSKLLHQLPDSLELLAASLRSGLGLLPALQYLVAHQQPPLAQEFALVIRKQRLGGTLEEALEEMRQSVGGAEIALFVTAVTVVRQLGGNLSEILTRLAQTLREKQVIEDKVSALTAQGKLQARIVGSLPVVLLVVMLRLEPQAMRPLYTTVQGCATLLVLIVLELVGLLVLRRVVRVDV